MNHTERETMLDIVNTWALDVASDDDNYITKIYARDDEYHNNKINDYQLKILRMFTEKIEYAYKQSRTSGSWSRGLCRKDVMNINDINKHMAVHQLAHLEHTAWKTRSASTRIKMKAVRAKEKERIRLAQASSVEENKMSMHFHQ